MREGRSGTGQDADLHRPRGRGRLSCPRCNEPIAWPGYAKTQSLNDSTAVYKACIDLAGLDHEEFWVLLLDVKNRPRRRVRVSVGSLSRTLVHPASVFKAAVREPAHAVVLLHNHPSGDPTPSFDDRTLTRRLVEAGDILGIHVLDHVIIGKEGWYSFADAGALRAIPVERRLRRP